MLGAGLGVAILSEEKTIEQLKQDSYASKEDCVRDWGSQQNCKEDTGSGAHSSGGGGSGGGGNSVEKRYYGPRYYWDRSAGHPVVVTDTGQHVPMPAAHQGGRPGSHSIGTMHVGSVSRGGFGHFGFRSGGG